MAPDTPHPQITYFEELKRKGIHLSSLWMVVAIILIPDWRITAAIFAVLLVITLLFEHAYACNWPVMAPMYGFFFRKMLRRAISAYSPTNSAYIIHGQTGNVNGIRYKNTSWQTLRAFHNLPVFQSGFGSNYFRAPRRSI